MQTFTESFRKAKTPNHFQILPNRINFFASVSSLVGIIKIVSAYYANPSVPRLRFQPVDQIIKNYFQK
jgi:hypothetical protein